jgi:hypothetical protein
MRRWGVASLVFLFAGAAFPQAVVSTHSGVLNFSEGELFFDDQPVKQTPGAFPALHDGSVLRTDKGRAEILLTPGVFLRVDENSSFKMVSTSLVDTRVELLTGSVIVDSSDAAKTDGVLILYRAYQIRFPERGVYRINTEPGVLQPYSGVAEIAGDGPVPAKIDDQHQYFLDVGLKTERYGDGLVDTFTEWARNRSEAISADNAAAAASAGDPADLQGDSTAGALGVDPGLGGIPGIGIPGAGMPAYPPLANNSPLIFGGGLYSTWTPFLGVPFGAYPLFTTVFVPVYGGWPHPYPRPVLGSRYPIHAYPPAGLSSIVNGTRYMSRYPGVTGQPLHPIGGVHPSVSRPAVIARPMGGGGIHVGGRR